MSNQINVIHPYYHKGFWVFDDESKGLDKEPFVGGMEDLIEDAVEQLQIDNPKDGFSAIFSAEPFPAYKIVLQWIRQEHNGNVYSWDGKEGWLCPALQKFFPTAPKNIYIDMKSFVASH